MFSGFGLAVQDLASAIALLLPGFVAISLFEASNPAIARDRAALQWVMWSLVFSLLIYAGVHWFYGWASWPNGPLDPQFYAGLLCAAATIGYLTGRCIGSPRGRELIARRLRLLLPSRVWVEVMNSRQWVVVHLGDGSVLYGYPRRFTDDCREAVRELYIEEPHVLTSVAGIEGFEPYLEASGVLIDSSQIRFIQFLKPKVETDAAAAKAPERVDAFDFTALEAAR